MALSTAAKQALEKLKQGPVQLMVDPGGADEVEVFVRGGVSVTFIRGQETVALDLIGTHDLVSTGDGAAAVLHVEEESVDVLKVVFMDQAFNAGSSYQGFGKAAGESAREEAKAFRFRPWAERDSGDVQLDLWLCAPEGDAVKAMTPEAPWRYVQRFRALPDLTRANGELVGRITGVARA
jgi:hypothetical protein